MNMRQAPKTIKKTAMKSCGLSMPEWKGETLFSNKGTSTPSALVLHETIIFQGQTLFNEPSINPVKSAKVGFG